MSRCEEGGRTACHTVELFCGPVIVRADRRPLLPANAAPPRRLRFWSGWASVGRTDARTSLEALHERVPAAARQVPSEPQLSPMYRASTISTEGVPTARPHLHAGCPWRRPVRSHLSWSGSMIRARISASAVFPVTVSMTCTRQGAKAVGRSRTQAGHRASHPVSCDGGARGDGGQETGGRETGGDGTAGPGVVGGGQTSPSRV